MRFDVKNALDKKMAPDENSLESVPVPLEEATLYFVNSIFFVSEKRLVFNV